MLWWENLIVAFMISININEQACYTQNSHQSFFMQDPTLQRCYFVLYWYEFKVLLHHSCWTVFLKPAVESEEPNSVVFLSFTWLSAVLHCCYLAISNGDFFLETIRNCTLHLLSRVFVQSSVSLCNQINICINQNKSMECRWT